MCVISPTKLLGQKESTAINSGDNDSDDEERNAIIDEKAELEEANDQVDSFLTATKGNDFMRARIDSTKTVDENSKDLSTGDLSDESIGTDSDLSILDSMSDDDLD